MTVEKNILTTKQVDTLKTTFFKDMDKALAK